MWKQHWSVQRQSKTERSRRADCCLQQAEHVIDCAAFCCLHVSSCIFICSAAGGSEPQLVRRLLPYKAAATVSEIRGDRAMRMGSDSRYAIGATSRLVQSSCPRENRQNPDKSRLFGWCHDVQKISENISSEASNDSIQSAVRYPNTTQPYFPPFQGEASVSTSDPSLKYFHKCTEYALHERAHEHHELLCVFDGLICSECAFGELTSWSRSWIVTDSNDVALDAFGCRSFQMVNWWIA